MANSTIPGLVAVSVPALTDLFGVRQSGDTRDKKLTVTQLLTLIPSGGDVTKVGTPVDNELGVWTGDGTLEGDTNLQWSGSRLTIAASGLILPAGSAAGPSQVFTGSLATGWYTPVANVISASIAGVQRWSFQADKFNSAGDGGTLNFTATDVIPGCIPRGTDLNTGIGGNGADTLTAIAGGLAGQFWNETNAGVLSGYASSPTVTAFATGGQGGATVLINSYNIVTTVATTGDSVRLQGTHDLGSVVYCKNEGANSLDIFPASGDDLGAGVDTAVAIPAGEFKCFITTVAQSTWTELLPVAAGGGGDVTKVGTPVNNQVGVWTGDGTLEGAAGLLWSGTILQVSGTIRVVNNGGGAILNEQVTLTNPSIITDVGDTDTGFGSGGGNSIAVIVGAQTYSQWRATGAGDGSLEATYDLTTGKTASTTQTQGQATQNSPEYSEITTVANPNDVITLGSAAAGRKITVVNSGANVLQIFPTSGGDLGQGLNASTTLAVGHSLTWIGKSGGVWAVIGFSDGGDVTKVGTPANDQLAVWTGDGTLEGNANFNVVGTAFRSTLGNGPSIVNVSSTSGTVPSLIPRQGDPNTGVSNAGDDRIALTAGGVMAIRAIEAAAVISSIDLFGPTVVTGSIRVTDAAGPQIQNEAASATNPTFTPNRTDDDTGIGWNAADALSLIAGGVEIARLTEAVEDQFIISPGAFLGSAALPALAFGDGDTGFSETFDDTLQVSIAGVAKFNFADAGNSFQGAISGSGGIRNEVGSATNPTLIPNVTDTDTGIGWNAADAVSIVAGGVEAFTFAEAAAVITCTFRGDLVASGGGGAGPSLRNVGASASVPTVIPNQADPDTGLSRDTINGVSMVAGGLGCIRGRNIGGARAVGFYTTTPIVQQTGVAVTDVAIHAALVALGLITA